MTEREQEVYVELVKRLPQLQRHGMVPELLSQLPVELLVGVVAEVVGHFVAEAVERLVQKLSQED